jgi:hypothetical protein
MFESGSLQFLEPVFVQQGAACYQVRVQVARLGMLYQGENIFTNQGFTAREVELDHAEICSLRKRLTPLLGAELIQHGVEIYRIRAIHTFERTTVGEFGNDSVGTRRVHA